MATQSKFKSLMGTIKRRPTKNADGRNDAQAAESVGASTTKQTSILHDLTHMNLKDRHTIAGALTSLASGEPMDDKKLLLENGVSMLQSFPLNSSLSSTISDGFIAMLWGDLPHPAPTLAGPTARYRRHDGGNNSPWHPEMGKAGSPYARNVPPTKPKGPNLPDVESVYDALLRREGPFRKHPSGLNRMFFSFATVVIHECFQTSRDKKTPFINDTSSYVDLSTVYGNTEKEQVRVRTYEDGFIYPDSVASERIMMMPPGVVAVAVLFSRNHNHIVENLLSINEDGKYKKLDQLNAEEKKAQDEDLFQLARNINVGFFASCVLRDYVAAILNTPRANSEWSLSLGKEIKQMGKRVERGSGNVVSVEFAVLYHWHAALSAADEKWMAGLIENEFGKIDMEDVTEEMFTTIMMKYGHKLRTTLPKNWTFGGLERKADGKFDDAELAKVIKDCVEEPAHEFGAHGTPLSLKIVDIMGQLQARNVFNVCTLNEFRRYLNLKAYSSFEEWNPDKEVARSAELLYGHIENMELYPGLMAECTKPAIPGSGVCPGQTTGRGILDDAVSLVRGDRFLSYDFNANTLTHWGSSTLAEGAPGSYGGMLPRLIFGGLPGEFTGTSPYALLPFYTPEAAKDILKGNNVLGQYDLVRPLPGMEILSVQTHEGCKTALADIDGFREFSKPILQHTATNGKSNGVTNGNSNGVTNGVNGASHTPEERSPALQKAFFEEGFEKNVSEFFSSHTTRLIEKNSLHFVKGRKSFDVVRDVTNIVPILWLADRFAIPLKTAEHPKGLLSIYETFNAFLVLHLYKHFNIDPGHEWKLREGATQAAGLIRPIFETHLKTQHGVREKVVDRLAKGSAFEVGPHADRLYHGLINTKAPVSDLAGDLLDVATPIAGTLSQQAALLIDLFLSEGYESYKARIVELATSPSTPATERELQGFVYEGMRHAGAVPGIPRIAAKDITFSDGARGPVTIKAGRTVLVATSKAAMDPVAFPEPEKLNPHRDISEYALLGEGVKVGFHQGLFGAALAATLREVFKLKGIRRAKGKLGKFSIVEREVAGIKLRTYLDASSRENPVPTSLTLEYDA
ncbi:heme peroxidase [Microthyrium microscopicum]|uniref:Heme peroxidase n=1 Tax=Microthyrium microscopicum TaxID=703497 RepID=A0A6A6TXS6_9PEZI|nr:heme peroxidase [Microthyrium microscopicum]